MSDHSDPTPGAPAPAPTAPTAVAAELLAAFDRSARVNEFLVEAVPVEIWEAPPPLAGGRSIAGIFAHLLRVHARFAALASGSPTPAEIADDPSPAEARDTFRRTREALGAAFGRALTAGESTAGDLPRPVVDTMTYLMQHDAHHRGQITRQARELGHAMARDDVLRMFGWKALP